MAERVVQYSIKPKKLVGNKVLDTASSLDLQVDQPCGVCSVMFVSNNLVPFSCGCLFHPWYLWLEILGGCRTCLWCKKVVNSQWLELWGFDMLETNTPNPIPKEKGVGVSESSLFTMDKREAATNVDSQPTSKLTKTKDFLRDLLPLASKATHIVPPITALSPVQPFEWFVNRPCGRSYMEAVATAISTLAFHSTFLAEQCLDCILLLCWP